MQNRIRTLLIYWSTFIVLFLLYCYLTKKDEYKNSTRIEGVVVEMLEGYLRRGPYEYPKIQFTYNDSTRYFGDHMARFRNVGDRVELIIPNDDPEEVRIYNLFRYWVDFHAFFIGLLLAWLIFFLYQFLFTNRYRNN